VLRREVVALEKAHGDTDVKRKVSEVVLIRRVDRSVAHVERPGEDDGDQRRRGDDGQRARRATAELRDLLLDVREKTGTTSGAGGERQGRQRGNRDHA
jgi:hypothetical protein